MTYIPNPSRYDQMIYRPAGNSGLLLPALSLGLWHNFGSVDDFENARAMIHIAFDLGITHFDLANNYGPEPGSAERNFGRILKEDFQGLRDELIISTKAGYVMWPGPYGNWGSRKSLLASLDQSLGALKTALDSGKALYVGLSNYSAKETEAAVLAAEKLGFKLLIHQPRYSMLDRWIEDDLQETLTEAGIGTIAFKPLYQGLLTGKYLHGIPENSRMRDPHYATLHDDSLTTERLEQLQALNDLAQSRGQSLAQMALAWVLRERASKVQAVTSALIGASRPQQIIENVAALERLEFTDEELINIENLL